MRGPEQAGVGGLFPLQPPHYTQFNSDSTCPDLFTRTYSVHLESAELRSTGSAIAECLDRRCERVEF
jgi:hypothetical protein